MRFVFTQAPARRGIGRLEVIVAVVVVVIIASVGIALLLQQQAGGDAGGADGNLSPKELRKKQSANLMVVRNNLKQLILGCQNHHDTKKTFPPLFFSADPKLKGKLNVTKAKGNYPWTVALLPFIEEDTLYRTISKASNKYMMPAQEVKIDHEGKKVSPRDIDLTQLQSPHLGERTVRGNNNYVALSATRMPLMFNIKSEGMTEDWKLAADSKPLGPDGMIIPDKLAKGQSMARMADGPSMTAVICESRELEKSNWYEPAESFVVGFLPGDSTASGSQFYPYYDKRKWVTNPKTGDRTALDYGPTAEDAKHVYNAANGPLARAWGPSGGNPIGKLVVHAMGDGSVRMISTDIDPQIYFALITTRGGENIPPPEDAKVEWADTTEED